jgi:hypothetical protein
MTIFHETEGVFSMRRVLAFILAIVSIGLGVVTVLLKSEWQVVACAIGIPLLGTVMLLFFTTWGDVASVVKAVKE